MKSLKMAAIGALLVGGQALGQSTFTFELSLGGNNNVANWEGQLSSDNWAFTGGNNADGQTYTCNDPNADYVTWSTSLVVNGVHSVGGFTAKGAANIVYDLEMHAGTAEGPLVAELDAGGPADTGWFSTINDGDDDGLAGGARGADPLENAAFPVAFNAMRDDPPADTVNRGRLIDVITADGPFMDYFTYPSTDGRPVASTAAAGTLVGMGAGYSQYTASGCPGFLCFFATSTQNAGGVGDIVNSTGLGSGPVGEGQINMAGVPSGTYVLVLKARKSGNNILGDFDFVNQSPGSFALGVDAIANSGDGGVTGGDTITFNWVNNCGVGADVNLTSAVSRKTHPAAAPVVGDIDMLAVGASEPRLGGPTKLVLGFDGNIQAAGGGAVTCANIGLSSGSCDLVSGSGTSELTVDVSGTGANSCLTVTLSNLEGDSGAYVGPGSLNIKVVLGDVDGNGVTNIVDLNTVKGDLFQGGQNPLTDYLSDVDVNGVVNIVDLNTTKGNLFGNVGTCP